MRLEKYNKEYFDILFEIIQDGLSRHPRSHQKSIGPSEVGEACERRVLLKMSGAPTVPGEQGWQAWVGTQAHSGMENIFIGENQLLTEAGLQKEGDERYVLEEKVTVGPFGTRGKVLAGSSDMFDRAEGAVWDWKFPGPRKMDKLHKEGPNAEIEEHYFIQAQCYGRGRENAGEKVNLVIIAYLPAGSNDVKKDAVIKVAEYDRSVSERVLKMLDRHERALEDSEPKDNPDKPFAEWTPTELKIRAKVIQDANVADSYCAYSCPYYVDPDEKNFNPAFECRGYAHEMKKKAEDVELSSFQPARRRIPRD